MDNKKYKFKTTPFDHQKKVLEDCWNRVNYAFFMEMGTGKTKVCIDNAGILFEKGKIDTFIVIAPKGVYRNWHNLEIPTHLPDTIKTKMMVWKPSPGKKEKENLMGMMDSFEGLR